MPEHPLVSVVDDDEAFRDSMRRLIRSLGYSVAVFASAAEFLVSAQRQLTSCLVADVQMPAMTGTELYRYLIAEGPVIPTILITAYPDDADRREMLGLGVACYLPKPLVENEFIRCLRATVDRALNRHGPFR